MQMPFAGMDPYLEHPILWEGLHARLVVAMANQLQPRLDPRYIASVEERVFIEGPQQRVPDIWIQKTSARERIHSEVQPDTDMAVVVEIEELEIHQKHIEILDAYDGLKLVAVIELLNPSNKRAGSGRESYLTKQQEILQRDCHLVEIDLLRKGERALSIPEWRLQEFKPFDYMICVSRWPRRQQFALYPRDIKQRLPRIRIPLAEGDTDTLLDVQAALEQVYVDGRYARRVRYDEPCDPPLTTELQTWATECWQAFRVVHEA